MPDTIIHKDQPSPDLLNCCGTFYFEEHKMSYQMYRNSIRIMLLDNALAAGELCAEYVISSQGTAVDCINVLSGLAGDYSLAKLKGFLQSLKFQSDRYGNMSLDLDATGKVKVSLSYRQSTRVYSPFALHHLKPLKQAPKKWNLTYAKRALANGQFTNLKCTGRYSDDYAYDAAVNFGKGPISAMPLLQDLVTSPSGWRSYIDEDSGRVTVNCHHFDNNSFVLQLEPIPETTDA